MRTEAGLTMWGKEQAEAPRLPWSWALERIQAAEDYWLVSAGERGPTARPVWGIWLDDVLVLSVGSSAHWHNLRQSSRVTVHLGDAHDVVVIEGSAVEETDRAVLSRMVEPYNAKYNWDFPPGEPMGPIVSVRPECVMAWIAAPNSDARNQPFPLGAGKWVFETA